MVFRGQSLEFLVCLPSPIQEFVADSTAHQADRVPSSFLTRQSQIMFKCPISEDWKHWYSAILNKKMG